MPQRLRLRPWRLSDLFPPFLDLVELPRGLLDVFRLGAVGRVEGVSRTQRLGLGDQFFLDGSVGEPFPLVHFAQLVEPRGERGDRRSQPFHQRMLFAFVKTLHGKRQLRWRIEGGSQISSGPIRFSQRQILGSGALLSPIDQLIDTLQLLPEQPFGSSPALVLSRLDRGLGAFETFGDVCSEVVSLWQRACATRRPRHSSCAPGARLPRPAARPRCASVGKARLDFWISSWFC